jgi:hypothetical protein
MTSLKNFVNVPNFPLAGTAPDLTFYYDLNWNNEINLISKFDNSLNNSNIPITLDDKSDPLTQNIGSIFIPEDIGYKIYNDPFIICFNESAGGGSITFSDNQISRNSTWGPNQTLVFEITGGSGNYTFSNGFVVIKTTEDLGRYMSVYFFKSESELPDLRGTWNFYVKVLRLESLTDTLEFPKSYKYSTVNGCILKQDWNGDKRFLSLTLPPNPPLRPTPGEQPGIITFVNGKLQLYLCDFDDNGVFSAAVSKTDNKGNVTGFKGLYTESGFSTNPDQKPTIGEWTLEKVL